MCICGLHASVHSNHWQTPCVQDPYPYASVTNDLNCVWAPLHLFTYTLGHWTLLAPRPLSIQPVDGLFSFGPLTLSPPLLMSGSSYASTSHKPLSVCFTRCAPFSVI